MRGLQLISAGLCFVVLGAAGPLRKDETYKHLARDRPAPNPISIIPVPDDTDPSIPATALTTALTDAAATQVPPQVSVRSTSYKNTTATLTTAGQVASNSAVPSAAQGSTDLPGTGTQRTAFTSTTSVIPASTTAAITSPERTTTQIQPFSFSNTTSNRVSNKATKTATLPVPLGTTALVPDLPKTNSADPQSPISKTSPIPSTETTPSTFTIGQTFTTQIPIPTAPTTTTNPSFTVTRIPSVLPASLQTATSISPAQYTANLAEARSYNAFFSTLNFSSPCTPGSIACLSGNMGTCNQAGNFVINVCATDSECFALPMEFTAGVVVQCRNKATASSVLGLVAAVSTTTSPSGGVITIPATTIEITSILSETAATTTSSMSPSPEPTFITITVVPSTFIQTTTSVDPVPAAPQVTEPPEAQTSTSIFRGVSIIPVTDQNVQIQKETVTEKQTVTETVTVTFTTTVNPGASAV